MYILFEAAKVQGAGDIKISFNDFLDFRSAS